jgi:hypothetical protein
MCGKYAPGGHVLHFNAQPPDVGQDDFAAVDEFLRPDFQQ